MFSALMFSLIVGGLVLMPLYPLPAVALCFTGFKLQRLAALDEDMFEGSVGLLGGLGALATVVQGLLVQFIG